MDFKELFKLMYIVICTVMLTIAFILVLGNVENLTTFIVVKLFGVALGVGAYKGLERTGVIQWLSR